MVVREGVDDVRERVVADAVDVANSVSDPVGLGFLDAGGPADGGVAQRPARRAGGRPSLPGAVADGMDVGTAVAIGVQGRFPLPIVAPLG